MAPIIKMIEFYYECYQIYVTTVLIVISNLLWSEFAETNERRLHHHYYWSSHRQPVRDQDLLKQIETSLIRSGKLVETKSKITIKSVVA